MTGDDAVLLAEARNRCPEAFAALVGRYEGLVTALVARASGAREETQDLVQDVFLDAYRSLGSLKDPSRFKGWLVSLALNRARALGRRRRVEAASRPRIARDGAREDEPHAEAADERRRLLAAVEDLPAEARAVVTLRYLEDRSSAEIAETLGVTPEAVRMRLSRALARLREALRPEEGRHE